MCGKETHKFKAILRLQIGCTILISYPKISPTPLSLQETGVVVLVMEYFPETDKETENIPLQSKKERILSKDGDEKVDMF